MNRVEIKNAAKEKIKGNIWDLLWPLLVIGAVVCVLSALLGPKPDFSTSDLTNIRVSFGTPFQYGCLSIISIVAAIASAGYLKYVLVFIRTGKFDFNEIINTIKEKWLDLLVANLLAGVIIGIGYALLVIPGIIATLALALINFLIVDKNSKGADSLKESYELTKGYKWDLFVFGISFIGWALLVPLTLGILTIWLAPYMQVSYTMYYDKLVSQKNRK